MGAHCQQHQRRIANYSQEVAEEEGVKDRLQGGPVGEAQQEEALLCCGCPKAGNSRKVGKDNTYRVMYPLQAKENPDHAESGRGTYGSTDMLRCPLELIYRSEPLV